MRCTKCGFVSFDYHSECRKCGTSLAQARDQLGFSSGKPGVPFLLGALLKEHEPQTIEEKPAAPATVSPAFDFGDEFGGGFKQVDEFSLDPGAAVPNPDEGEEDYSLLDLSDEELESLIDREPADSAQKRPDFWLDLDSDKKSSEPPASGLETEHPVMQTESEEADRLSDLIPRFDSSSLPGPAEKTPRDAPPEPELVMAEPEELPHTPPASPETVAAAPERVTAPSEQAVAPPEKEAGLPGEATDDFVIDLTDSDLENLLMELDSSQKMKDPEQKDSIPPGPKSKE